MWYKNSYRRHLMDMHINDWGEDIFLRDFDPEVYCDNLKAAKEGVAITNTSATEPIVMLKHFAENPELGNV